MSFIPVLEYIVGLVVFGFVGWLLDGIVVIFRDMNIADTTSFGANDILWMCWYGTFVVYLIFGGIMLVRKYNEIEQQKGMF